MTQGKGRVLVVGSVNMDLVTHVISFPNAGETRLGSNYSTYHGGKGANQAVAAARMGSPITFVGRVGSDAFGMLLRQGLLQEGIDVTHLDEVDGTSGVAFIAVNEHGENTIIVAPGANAALTPETLPPEAFAGVNAVLLQLEIPLATVKRALELAKAAGALTVVNAAPADAVTLNDLKNADVLVCNETEAALLLNRAGDQHNLTEAIEALADHVPNVVVTLGKNGVMWRREGKTSSLPAFAVEAVDTTAAGDAFVGSLTASLAAGLQWHEGLQCASAAGALAVTRPGAQPSLPRRDEVTRFLAQAKPASIQ